MSDSQRVTRIDAASARAQLGPYQVVSELGQGGMGMVYRGYDPNLDRNVAIKVLYPHLARDAEFTARFLREARTAARIEHANVVSVYAADQLDGEPGCYLAMQFVDGIELHRLIKERGPLSVELALFIAREIGRALEAAGDEGIVHRDIKPDNVLIDRGGRVRVTDFGLARGVRSEARLTETGVFLGTPEYSAPEQCQTDEIDHRADLYALGVVLYEMMSGQLPHKAPTPYSLFQRIVEEEPVALRILDDTIPPAVERLVMADLLAKKPGARLPDARTLVQRIETLLAGLGASDRDFKKELSEATRQLAGEPETPRGPESDRESHDTIAYSPGTDTIAPPTRAGRRRRPLLVGTAVVLVCLAAGIAIGLAAFGASRPAPTPAPIATPTPTPDALPAQDAPPPVASWRDRLTWPVRVAVLDFDSMNEASAGDDLSWYRVGLTELVISNLFTWSDLRVLDRDYVRQAIGVDPSGLGDGELADRLSVDLVVRGRYQILPSGSVYCQVSVQAPDGDIIARQAAQGPPDQLFDIVERLGRSVVEQMKASLRPDDAPATLGPLATSDGPGRPTPPDRVTSPPVPDSDPAASDVDVDDLLAEYARIELRFRDHLAKVDETDGGRVSRGEGGESDHSRREHGGRHNDPQQRAQDPDRERNDGEGTGGGGGGRLGQWIESEPGEGDEALRLGDKLAAERLLWRRGLLESLEKAQALRGLPSGGAIDDDRKAADKNEADLPPRVLALRLYSEAQLLRESAPGDASALKETESREVDLIVLGLLKRALELDPENARIRAAFRRELETLRSTETPDRGDDR